MKDTKLHTHVCQAEIRRRPNPKKVNLIQFYRIVETPGTSSGRETQELDEPIETRDTHTIVTFGLIPEHARIHRSISS